MRIEWDYSSLEKAIIKVLDEWGLQVKDVKCIVSGGAKGTDNLAERFAKEYNFF